MSIDFDDKKKDGVGPQSEQAGLGEPQSLEDATLSSDVSRQDYLLAESGETAFEAVLSGPVSAAEIMLNDPEPAQGTVISTGGPTAVVGIGPREKTALEILGGLEIPDNLMSPEEVADLVDSVIQESPGVLSQIASRFALDEGRTFSVDEARGAILLAAVREWTHINGTINESQLQELGLNGNTLEAA